VTSSGGEVEAYDATIALKPAPAHSQAPSSQNGSLKPKYERKAVEEWAAFKAGITPARIARQFGIS